MSAAHGAATPAPSRQPTAVLQLTGAAPAAVVGSCCLLAWVGWEACFEALGNVELLPAKMRAMEFRYVALCISLVGNSQRSCACSW